jgi:excisionase family DNA binding protein
MADSTNSPIQSGHLLVPLFDYDTAAEVLQVSRRTVRRLCLLGELKLTYVGTGGRTPRVDPASVAAFIDRRTFVPKAT